MALYTDGPPSSIEDLSAQDSQLLDVASTEGIDLTKKLALAHEQAGIEIEELLRRRIPAAGMELHDPGAGNRERRGNDTAAVVAHVPNPATRLQ